MMIIMASITQVDQQSEVNSLEDALNISDEIEHNFGAFIKKECLAFRFRYGALKSAVKIQMETNVTHNLKFMWDFRLNYPALARRKFEFFNQRLKNAV